jgi:hypothetical protein
MSEGYDFGAWAEARGAVIRSELRCARCGHTFGVRMGPGLSSLLRVSYNCHFRETDCLHRRGPAEDAGHVTYDLDTEPELIAVARKPPCAGEC